MYYIPEIFLFCLQEHICLLFIDRSKEQCTVCVINMFVILFLREKKSDVLPLWYKIITKSVKKHQVVVLGHCTLECNFSVIKFVSTFCKTIFQFLKLTEDYSHHFTKKTLTEICIKGF